MATDQFFGQDDDEIDVRDRVVPASQVAGRFFDENRGTFRKPVSLEEAGAEFRAMLEGAAEDDKSERPVLREAYERMGAGSGTEYNACLRLVEGVRNCREDPQEARELITEHMNANRITRLQARRLLKQLQDGEDADREAPPEPVRRFPPPAVLEKMRSPTFIKLVREMKSGEPNMRQRIEEASRAGLLRKGERGMLICGVDRIVSDLRRIAPRKKSRDELFVEGPMDVPQKPQLFRRPVAGERKATDARQHLGNGEGIPKPTRIVSEGLAIVNAGPRGIAVVRSR